MTDESSIMHNGWYLHLESPNVQLDERAVRALREIADGVTIEESRRSGVLSEPDEKADE